MLDAFVLISESGEYENFTRSVLGVFLSESAARASIPKFQKLAERQWQLYQERQKRRDEYLANHFTPHTVYPPGSPFPDGCTLYENDQYKEAEAAIGPEVPLVSAGLDGYEYVIEPFNCDAVEPRS